MRVFVRSTCDCRILFTILLALRITDSVDGMDGNNTELCTFRIPTFKILRYQLEDRAFKLSTCAMCYFYLVKDKPIYNLTVNCTGLPFGGLCLRSGQSDCACPSVDDADVIDSVCESLSDFKCSQFKKCCSNAWTCCQKQKQSTKIDDTSLYCPQTWDGWGCWDYTKNGTFAEISCPAFLYKSGNAYKNCTDNGRWWQNAKRSETANYDDCFPENTEYKIKLYKDATIVGLAFNSFGIILLIPSLFVFFWFRQLRCQQRIKLHINFFISLLLNSIMYLFWDTMVRYNRIVNDEANSLLHNNQAACKTLYIMRRSANTSTYFWMLCEGFYLHRLLVKSFEPHQTLILYYIFGWVSPVVVCVAYAILRESLANDKLCWINPTVGEHAGLEYLLVGVTCFCLFVNLLFFINVMRILFRQISRTSREPSYFRKALKATFVLIPLFGVQQFFQIYQPTADQEGYNFFLVADAVMNNSQGILISLIFCLLNGEVLSYLKTFWKQIKYNSEDRRKSMTSQTTSRRLSASSDNIRHIGNRLPYVSSYPDVLSDAVTLTENSNKHNQDEFTNDNECYPKIEETTH